jgi:hypothetical protein
MWYDLAEVTFIGDHMKRWIALIMTLVALLFPLTAQAQAVQISQLQIDLWPEYDRRELLVIYRITLADSVGLPAKISLRIPSAAGAPFTVAMKDPADGLLYVMDYTLLDEGNWQRVNLTTSSRELQIEYYDPSITFEGANRFFTYQWPGDYTVDNLSVVIQRPINSENVRFSPSMGDGSLNPQDGLTYYNQDVGKVPAGTTFRLSMNYTKTDDNLSANQIPVSASQPLDQPDTRQVSATDVLGVDRNILIWLLMIAGAGMMIGAVIWLIRSGKQNRKRGRNRHASGEKDEFVYCTECGSRARKGDAFCRTCGTKLRG